MGELLAAAGRQLATVPSADQQPRWRGQLARLTEARTGLERTYAYWQAECTALPPSSGPGTEAYDEPLAERNAEAWSYLCDWADTGHVLIEISEAAVPAGPASGAAPSAENTRVRPGKRLPPHAPDRPRGGTGR
jgi:hypothetical protein